MAFPCAVWPPIAQNPCTPSALRAAATALVHAPMELLKFFLARVDDALETILPFLFLVSLSLVKPLKVLTFEPEKTAALARFPFPITDLAFISFMTFMALGAFIAAFMVPC